MQATGLSVKALRAALEDGDDVVLYDGDEPLGRLVSIAAEIKRRGEFFVHYPHDPAECANTCWRHDPAVQAAAAAEAEAEAEAAAMAARQLVGAAK